MTPRFSMRTALLFQLLLYWNRAVFLCNAFTIDSKSWDYKGHRIAYEELKNDAPNAPRQTTSDDRRSVVLLLNGFGVGSFHQHRLMPQLLTSSSSSSKTITSVYAIDYLGQGRSWPSHCDDGNSPSEVDLIYSADMWVDQIERFIEERILSPNGGNNGVGSTTAAAVEIHLVGNSVGGYLAAVLAARRPDLITSICLLNATPVWGLNLPGWDGRLPPPRIPRAVGRFLFDRIRDRGTIGVYLGTCYANRAAFDDGLISDIKSCTEGKGGHAAFASILWSPPASFASGATNFYSNLSKLRCDVLIINGKNDPICKPSFGRRMFAELIDRRDGAAKAAQRYIELDNVGHCPNHEAPTIVGQVVRRWVGGKNDDGRGLLLDGEVQTVSEPWGDVVAREIVGDGARLGVMDRLVTRLVR